MSKIGVFPAAGGLGSSIVNHLANLVPASQLILIARKPENLNEFKQQGAEVRRADYEDSSTLEGVFEGVDVLMLISYASFEIDFRVKVHHQAIDLALRSGVRHIFYSSLGFGGDLEDHSVAHVMGAHLATEKYLAELHARNPDSFSYTSLREGLYSESFPIYTSWFDPARPVAEISIPHDGSGPGIAWVKRDELGEATAKLIAACATDPAAFAHRNQKLLLSGPLEMSLNETAEVLGKAAGRPVRIREISVDEYVRLPQHGDKHTYHGVDLAREWASAWEAIRRGETAVVSPLLKEILGREPESFEKTVSEMIR